MIYPLPLVLGGKDLSHDVVACCKVAQQGIFIAGRRQIITWLAYIGGLIHILGLLKAQVFEMVLTKDPEPVWDKEVAVDEKWIQFVDESVSASKLFIPDLEVLEGR